MDHRRIRGLLLLAGLFACGEETATSAETKADAAPPPAPAITQMREIFQESFYRAPGGTAITLMPKELREAKIRSAKMNQQSRLLEFLTEPPGVVLFSGIFPKSAASAINLESLGKSYVPQVKKLVESIKLKMEESPLKLESPTIPGGQAVWARYGARNAAGKSFVADLVVIADGVDAAIFSMIGAEKDVTPLSTHFLQNTRVGTKVPRLPAHDPKTALSGVYQGPTKTGGFNKVELKARWMFFDPGGYAHRFAPKSEAELDIEALYQWASLEPFVIYRYELSGDSLRLTPITGKAGEETLSLQKIPGALSLNNETFSRVDGLFKDGETLEGSYEYYRGVSSYGGYSSSTTYAFRFSTDGSISYDGGTSIQGQEKGSTGLISSVFGSYSKSGSYEGTYRFEGGRLLVKAKDGRELSYFVAPLMEGEKRGQGITVDGLIYLKD